MTPRLVYLAGAIMGEADCAEWRDHVVSHLPRNWVALNPLDVETSRMTCVEVVRCDYQLILRSSAVIAYVGVRSWGTAMEIAFAKQHGIPVVGWKGRKPPDYVESKWLIAHTTAIMTTWEGAIDMLGELS